LAGSPYIALAPRVCRHGGWLHHYGREE
jgi:hypothetical protein